MYGPKRGMDKITEQFNESQDGVFATDVFLVSHTELMQKIQVTAASSSGLPDAVLIDMFYAPLINDLVGNVDLKPYIDADPTMSYDDFYENLRDYSMIDGKQISIHSYANNLILYYNKSLFEAAGLDPNKPPATWDELVTYAQALTTGDQLGFLCSAFYDSYYETVSWQYQVFVWQNGGEMWDENWQPAFNSPEGIEALQFMMDLIHKHGVSSTAPPENGFHQGKVAMLLDGTWMGNELEDALGDNLMAAPLPYNKAPATNTGGEHWMILPSEKAREDAAWQYISHFLSEAVVTEICANGGQVPTRKSIADSDAFQSFANEHVAIKTSMSVMDSARMRAASPNYGAASEAMSTYIQQALFNTMTAEDAVAAAAEAFAAAINQ